MAEAMLDGTIKTGCKVVGGSLGRGPDILRQRGRRQSAAGDRHQALRRKSESVVSP